MGAARVIRLPLAEFEQFFFQGMSSDDFQDALFQAFFPADMVYTFFFRYPRLVAHDLPGNDATEGASIDFTGSHPLYAIFITLAIGGLAALNLYHAYQKQKKAQQNTSYQFIHSELRRQGQLIDAKLAEDKQHDDDTELQEAYEITRKWLGENLDDIRKNNQALRDKYDSIAIELDEKTHQYQLVLTRRSELSSDNNSIDPIAANKPGWFRRIIINKIVNPFWQALSITAFAYWLLWIGSGLFTAKFGVGVSGMTPWIGFGIPFLIGMLYIAFKSYHWYKHNYANRPKPGEAPLSPEEQMEAEQDACRVFRSALLCKRFEPIRAQLQSELGDQAKCQELIFGISTRSETLDKEVEYLDKEVKAKMATTFTSKAVNFYIMAQYGAWFVTDFLSVAAKVTADAVAKTICGWLFIAASLAYGIYHSVKTYRSVKEHQAMLDERAKEAQKGAEDIDIHYTIQLKQIKELEQQILDAHGDITLPKTVQFNQPQFFEDVTRDGPTSGTRFKKYGARALQFVNGITSGVFIARIFLVKGTAIFLPFAVAALSNPIALGLILGIGIVYGLFKMYEYHKKRKEERALALEKQYSDHIACAKQKIQVNDMCIQVLQKRLSDKKAENAKKLAAAPSPKPVLSESPSPKLSPSSPALFLTPRSRSSSNASFYPAQALPITPQVLANG